MQLKFDTSFIGDSKITKKEILSRLSECDIYNKYLGFSPLEGKKFRSPFGKDSNPSFYFYNKGEWLWKDFSAGDSGDCIGLVCSLYNLSYMDAMLKIANDMGLYKHNVTAVRKEYVENINKAEKQSAVIDIVLNDWTPEYLKYWEQYGLSLQDIDNKTTFVKPCKEVWVNDNIVYNYLIDKDICFRYLFNGKYKVYRPLSKKKDAKWVSNCTINEVQNIANIYNYSSDLLILTKSYKDTLCLNKLGYNAIAFGSEAATNVDSIITWLKSKFKRVVVFYDNDAPGIKYSNILSNKYELEQIFIPGIDEDIKDVSDWIKESSLDEGLKLLKNLL